MKNKLIFKPQVARKLLKLGNKIVDIKASKENSDRSVFVFEETEKFKSDLKTILEIK